MGRYRYLAYDLMSNEAVAELELSGVSFGGVLNGAGDFTATIPVDPDLATMLATATTPERTIVYIERDGVLMPDAFIIWRRMRSSGPSWPLKGSGLPSILRRQRIIADLTYTATDQFAIARGIVDHVQAQTGADFGIDTGSATSGVTRDRAYYAYERKNAGEALAQLAAVDGGFDWAIDIAWGATAPARTLTLSHPRRGRTAGTTGLVFELGKNIVDYKVDEQGDRSARSVDMLGAGDGNDMRISTSTRTDLLDAGYPLTSQVLAAKDVTEQATLDAHAVAETSARAATPTFWQLSIDPDDPDGGLGTWILGDDVLVRITDHNFPVQSDDRPGYEAYHRIVAYKVTVGDDGAETVEVTLGQVAA